MIAYVPATTRMVQPQTLELDSGGVCDRLRLCGRVVGSATERKNAGCLSSGGLVCVVWPLVCDVVQSSGRLVLLVWVASGALMLVFV